MKIIINETSAVKTLSLVAPESGINYISDFMGDVDALNDGQFEWDSVMNAYVCSQETFDWWDAVVTANQDLVNRIQVLINEHGSEPVHEVIHAAGSVDLEYHAARVNQALDEAFDSAEYAYNI